MEIFITQAFDNYFNSILKNVLKYNDIFTINVNIDNKTIYMKSNLEISELTKILNTNNKLVNKINTELLSAFINNNPNIGYIDILLYTDGLIIKWGYNLNSLKDIGPLIEIAKNVDYDTLEKLCETNKQLNKLCKDNNFWINLFQYKYVNITENLYGSTILPNYIPKNINYKKLYVDVTKYLDLVEELSSFKILYEKFIDLEKDGSLKNPFSDKINQLYLNIIYIFDIMNEISIIYLIKSKLFNIDKKLIPSFRNSKHGFNLNVLTELLSNYKLYYINIHTYIREVIFNMFSIPDKFETMLNILELLIYHVRDNNTQVTKMQFLDMLEKSLDILNIKSIPLTGIQLDQFVFIIRTKFPNIDLTPYDIFDLN